MTVRPRELDALRARHDAAWRDPAEVATQWPGAGDLDPRLLQHRVRGRWWETLAEHDVTLLVTREYEHFALALRAGRSGPSVSWVALPHPSGIAVDARRGVVHVASTRNPNQVFDFVPATPAAANGTSRPGVLVPVRSRLLPGSLYMHDLAMVGGRLHANAVGQNAVVRLDDDGGFERVWWPRSIDPARFGRNYLQLNSIAAGPTLARSFFSASAERPSPRRPGHRNFPVDGRGVIFSGATREPIARGLTRPHSARLHGRRLWVDNSGYGEVGVVDGSRFEAVARLPGWTRGLAFAGGIAIVGSSRVLPRFRQYAPGLDVDRSVCGLHAIDLRSGSVVGSLLWPYGNQIFAVECVPARWTTGFPFAAGLRRALARERAFFYAFETRLTREKRTHER